MIKHTLLVGLFLGTLASLNAQAPDSVLNFYWASFSDKDGSPYSVDEPEAYLSQRAIERRERLNIPVSQQDFPPNPDYLKGLEAAGGHVHHRSRWLNAATFFASDSAASAVAALPYVDTVWIAGPYRKPLQASLRREINYKVDSLLSKRMEGNKYGYGERQIDLIEGDSLHAMGYRGEGVWVAVLDGGFIGLDVNPFFDSLRAEGRLLYTLDVVDGDTLVAESSTHGTKVLSTMAADQPEVFVGTAPEASYICIKTEDTRGEHRIEECHWVAGIEFADSMGVDIVNSSLGYTIFDDASMNYDTSSLTGEVSVASQAAEIAVSKGIIVVTSAGNEGGSPWRYIGIPADAPSALAVGATDLKGKLASFSSVGLPQRLPVKPDVIAPGAWVFLADAYRYRVSMGSGTSFASPITAGAVACLRQAFPDVPAPILMEAVRRSGSLAEQPNSDEGYGLPDFAAAYEWLKQRVKQP